MLGHRGVLGFKRHHRFRRSVRPLPVEGIRRRHLGSRVQTAVPSAEWRAGEKGRLGVYARGPLEPGQVVERCYSLCLDDSMVSGHAFGSWLYPSIATPSRYLLLPLGWGMLYNEACHRDSSNLAWHIEEDVGPHGKRQFYMTYRTSRAVEPREELLVEPRRPRDPSAGPLQDVLTEAMLSVSRQVLHGKELPERPDIDGANVDIANGVLRPPTGIEVRHSRVHGNGVFATRRFRRGSTVEVAPNLLATMFLLNTSLRDYVYHAFEPDNGILQVSLGHGSVYNHSDGPNLKYCMATSTKRSCAPAQRFSTRYYAVRDIELGEELTISYGLEWWPSRRE
mmetsp:Transcript_77383/g.224518  ORF Transcript_77383/g.224518 Transcript_77383/m.224518 type:complete len:337 (-) Transcript_77383:86-1096(-)